MKSLIETQQEPVIVKTYDNSVDEYGQMHTSYTERTAHMYLTKYVQTPNSDIRFNDVVLIGITHDLLSDRDNVVYKGKEYHCTHTIEGIGGVKWNQCFLELYEN